VALPKELEETEPSFSQIQAADIPKWEQDQVQIKLIAGEAFGRKSPVPVHSSLYFLELKSKEAQKISIGNDLFGESALYILEGSITAEGTTFDPQQILIAKDSKLCEFEMGANTTVYIFGGEAFPEERFIDWNFVSSSKDRLRQAREDWKQQRFPKIKGETEFVPYPTLNK
jgi:redox-sensitive bicupin YhaK (pirin superfamily)